jgi:hypothetical protein
MPQEVTQGEFASSKNSVKLDAIAKNNNNRTKTKTKKKNNVSKLRSKDKMRDERYKRTIERLRDKFEKKYGDKDRIEVTPTLIPETDEDEEEEEEDCVYLDMCDMEPMNPDCQPGEYFLKGMEDTHNIYCCGYVLLYNMMVTHDENTDYDGMVPWMNDCEYKSLASSCIACHQEVTEGFFCLEMCELRMKPKEVAKQLLEEEQDEEEEEPRNKMTNTTLKFLSRTICHECTEHESKIFAPGYPWIYKLKFEDASETILRTLAKHFSDTSMLSRPSRIVSKHTDACRICSKERKCGGKSKKRNTMDADSVVKTIDVKDEYGDVFSVDFYVCSKECQLTLESMLKFSPDFYKWNILEEVSGNFHHRSFVIGKVYNALAETMLKDLDPKDRKNGENSRSTECALCDYDCVKHANNGKRYQVRMCNVCNKSICNHDLCAKAHGYIHNCLRKKLSLSTLMITYSQSGESSSSLLLPMETNLKRIKLNNPKD